MKFIVSTHKIKILLFNLSNLPHDTIVRERGINLIGQLEEEDKQVLFRIIDSMLTSKKFKEFFNKNVASL